MVQDESGIDAHANDRDTVGLGQVVEFLGEFGVLGLWCRHLLGDAHDVDAGRQNGAEVVDLVLDPRSGGDGDDVNLARVEDGAGIGGDLHVEGIDAEHLTDVLAVQSRVDVNGSDELQSFLGGDELGHAATHRSQPPLNDANLLVGIHLSSCCGTFVLLRVIAAGCGADSRFTCDYAVLVGITCCVPLVRQR